MKFVNEGGVCRWVSKLPQQPEGSGGPDRNVAGDKNAVKSGWCGKCDSCAKPDCGKCPACRNKRKKAVCKERPACKSASGGLQIKIESVTSLRTEEENSVPDVPEPPPPAQTTPVQIKIERAASTSAPAAIEQGLPSPVVNP